MTAAQERPGGWMSWTIEITVWKLAAALVMLPVLVLWFLVVHQNDEILALIRNEVVTDVAGKRSWAGSFVNTNDQTLRDVSVTVDFLDSQDRPVGKANAEAAQLPFGTRVELYAPLPPNAAKLRIYSVQWRMGKTAALMGPFREPWEFGYLMADPARIHR
ncbi:MAG: FxLYD domain-containing protein [Steroidobacteraceae bacterium]